jgi:dihydroxyacetone kinase
MSNKHFLPNDTSKLVPNCLKALTYEYTFLSILERERVVFNNKFDRSKVSLISGGGSGHEPGFYGLVGSGMLSAVAHGEVFASPNYRNVKAAEKITHELVQDGDNEKPWAGCIFILTNYTGDNLYFGMAAQDLIALYGSEKIKILRVTDDVAIPRTAGALVGRRTLAGITIVSKLMGAASQLGHSIDEIFEFGQSIIDSVASVNAGLDHVHISGHAVNEDFGKLKPQELEIGLGIHNEPGFQKLDYIPRNEELVATLLKLILDTTDEERGFFKHSQGDKIVLLINNLGGVPIIEEKNILFTTLEILGQKYDIRPTRVYTGNFITSFNAQIFTVSLFNATTAKTKTFPVEKIFDFLDSETDAVCWSNTKFDHGITPIDNSKRIIKNFKHYDESTHSNGIINSEAKEFTIDPKKLDKIARTAAQRVIDKEPELTYWDTKMGDGDCGFGLKLGAELLIQKLDNDKIAESGSVLQVLHALLNIIKDDMGGTLGAIIFIFLKAVINNVEDLIVVNPGISQCEAYSLSFTVGLDTLFDYTKARVGHRTVMDVLIPFVESFAKDKDIAKAIQAAYEAAENTRFMKPRLGRATYVGLDDKKDLTPDPGAYGIYEAISALSLTQ